jgi:hypothetical protein
LQVLYQRCAAVDIGKDIVAVVVRLPGEDPDHRRTIKRTFKTFYGVLKLAAQWLTEQQVTHVAMEATGMYSMPVYHALIEHGQFEKVLVCNAGHVRNVPRRVADLLTELLQGVGGRCVPAGVGLARFAVCDQRWRSAAGFGGAGGGGSGCFGGHRRSVPAVSVG